ncbi:uncharacterized protein LOC115421909 isoform X3 [Sphaeramia orbicularis]|uniref:uncharacterized protein LOC115421909 isoform X3 n=1 Tax=Sphaeramia orbicularis TaxID=375764 RepID=UPI00117C44D5|nr:uncharacterized protein LOC115421909 isoform X3 [Sphaeramia orbicularis]
MQALTAPLQQFIGAVKDNGNSLIFSVLIFCFHEQNSTFPCTCKPQASYCTTYMVCPFFIITSLMLLTDQAFRRAWRYTTTKGCHFGLVLCRRVVKAVCIGSLWVVSVLIRADWYVCCWNPNSVSVARLQCQSQVVTNPDVVTVKEMEINSRMYGMALLLGITVMAALLLPAWTVFTKGKDAEGKGGGCCSSQVQVDELLLEVQEEILTKTIKEKQTKVMTESLNSHISKGDWVRCFHVVDDFIDEHPPVVAEEKKKKDEEETQESAENQEICLDFFCRKRRSRIKEKDRNLQRIRKAAKHRTAKTQRRRCDHRKYIY